MDVIDNPAVVNISANVLLFVPPPPHPPPPPPLAPSVNTREFAVRAGGAAAGDPPGEIDEANALTTDR